MREDKIHLNICFRLTLLFYRLTAGTEVRGFTKGFGNIVYMGLSYGLDDLPLPVSSEVDVPTAAGTPSDNNDGDSDASSVDKSAENNTPPPDSAFPTDDQPPLFCPSPSPPEEAPFSHDVHTGGARDWKPQMPPWTGAADADAEMEDWSTNNRTDPTPAEDAVCKQFIFLIN